MTTETVPTADQIDRECALVCESLVREIARAGRWKAVVEAWQALLHVRLMHQGMAAERTYIATGQWPDDRLGTNS